MKNNLIITEDNFVYVDVTDIAEKLFQTDSLELYVMFDDQTTSLVQYEEIISFARAQKLRVVIEGGRISPLISWSKEAPRELIGGYWYTKISDTKLVCELINN